ncbi:MAG: PilN domain-containing protein, partial [Xylophilus sp.]|nr:PilN domain-containing protein [Xylophilus sp.]
LTDDTSLRSLQIQGLKVNIEGQTGNAAELMQLLGRQPGFRDVVAPTAATRPFGAAKDNFKIEFMLEPKKMADTQRKAGDSPAASAPVNPVATVTAPGHVASASAPVSAATPKKTP